MADLTPHTDRRAWADGSDWMEVVAELAPGKAQPARAAHADQRQDTETGSVRACGDDRERIRVLPVVLEPRSVPLGGDERVAA